MPLSFTVNVDTANANGADQQAAKLMVNAENDRRAAEEPPGTPLPITPVASLLASYKTVLQDHVLANAHNSYVVQASTATHAERKVAFDSATPAVQSQIDTLLGL